MWEENDRELVFRSSKFSILVVDIDTPDHITERASDIIVLQKCDKFDEINLSLQNNYNGLNGYLPNTAVFIRKNIRVICSYKFNSSHIMHLSIYNERFILAIVHLTKIMDLYKELEHSKLPFIVTGEFNEESTVFMDKISFSAYKKTAHNIYASCEFKLYSFLPLINTHDYLYAEYFI